MRVARAVLQRRGSVIGLVLVALAIGASTGRPARARPAAQATQAVSIVNFSFQPATLTVPAGTRVTWTNNDSVAHTSTADGGAWDSGRLDPGQSFSHTFDTPGTFTYHCAIHPFMTGMITVEAPSPTPAPAPAASPTPAPGQVERVDLFAGCNNVSLTWPDGTPAATVAAAVTPPNALQAIWRFDNSTQTFRAFSPQFPQASDLTTVNRFDAVFICMNAAGTLMRPGA
jgi:plastocyanin